MNCQEEKKERDQRMENANIEILQQAVIGEVEKCKDISLLDLIYKLLVYEV